MESQKEPQPNYLLYPPQAPVNVDNKIDIRELFNTLWKGRWLIIVMTFVFGIGSIIYSLCLPNIYKADALLAPAENSNGGGLATMAGQLGGLAALAGVNIGSSESSQTNLAVQVMKSRQFIDSFVNNHHLLIPLMAAKGWDMGENVLLLDSDIYDSESEQWMREPDGMRGSKPTSLEAYEVFSEDIFRISEDKDSGLYTVSVRHYSPYIAQQWVRWLVEDINKVMRERTITETSQNLAYLNTQLQKTAVADMQSTFYKLIEDQTQSLMLAEVQEEFVFKIVDPAVVPELKAEPKRFLICLLGTLIGGVFGVAMVLVRFVFRKEKLSTEAIGTELE